MMKPTLADRICISPNVVFQEVCGETVLLDLAKEHYFGLDEVGTRIWQLLKEHTSLGAVYEVMREEYEVEAVRLEEDLLAHVGELADAGLITLGGGPHAPAP